MQLQQREGEEELGSVESQSRAKVQKTEMPELEVLAVSCI
jgi:hypothetical protein